MGTHWELKGNIWESWYADEASKHEFNKLDCPPHLVLLQEHHLNKDECLKFGKVMEFKNEAIMWNHAIQLGRSLRWSPRTTILVSPKLTPTILDHGIIMQGQTQFLLFKMSDGDVLRIVNVYVAQTSCEKTCMWKAIFNANLVGRCIGYWQVISTCQKMCIKQTQLVISL
jgi:hypothetical protein